MCLFARSQPGNTCYIGFSLQYVLGPDDAILVDFPGLEDVNNSRSSIVERRFSLHRTHAWYCLPKPECRILSDATLRRQIRVLGRGGRLGDLALVRSVMATWRW